MKPDIVAIVDSKYYCRCHYCGRVEIFNPHPQNFCNPACFKAYVLEYGQQAEVSDMLRGTGQVCQSEECG